jgi:hypothetical protein
MSAEPGSEHDLDNMELNEDTLTRYRRLLGDDHPLTLTSASNLAIDLRELGEVQAAQELDEDTLARRRHLLGDDHRSTLISANNLAIDLRELGEVQAARELDEDTLVRRRRVLGEDHPDPLISASNLAWTLRAARTAAVAWLIEFVAARRWEAKRRSDGHMIRCRELSWPGLPDLLRPSRPWRWRWIGPVAQELPLPLRFGPCLLLIRWLTPARRSPALLRDIAAHPRSAA